MNISARFVDRPIFAGVLSILVFLAGVIAILNLPVSEYPAVVPPSVIVQAQFPGANPKVIAETVAAPLEEQINGVENMAYMSSQATTDGVMRLIITFKIGTNVERAEAQVQNRVQRALPRLPEEVRRIGVTTVKSSPNITMVVHLLSPKGTYDEVYLRNYAILNVKDRLSRLPNMGDAVVFGSGDYAMRVWLDPQKVAQRGMTSGDVVAAIREQNVQVAAGTVGAPPDTKAPFQLSVNARGRLSNEEEFGNIIVKTNGSGGVTLLRDVARIELGANQYALRSLLNNGMAIGLGIFEAPNSNALQLSTDVRAVMEEVKKDFPPDMDYTIVYESLCTRRLKSWVWVKLRMDLARCVIGWTIRFCSLAAERTAIQPEISETAMIRIRLPTHCSKSRRGLAEMMMGPTVSLCKSMDAACRMTCMSNPAPVPPTLSGGLADKFCALLPLA